MATDVIMPALGMAQETGKVVKWLKEEGDLLVKGDPLVEIETDKVTVEIESPADGTLGEIWAAAETEVPVGTAIAVVLEPGEASPRAPSKHEPPPDEASPAAAAVSEGKRRLASPKARRLAESLGIDIATLAGSGPNGTVVASDVEALRDQSVPDREAQGTQPLSSLWRVMAERTTRSWQEVPQFVLQRDVDASRLQAWLESRRNEVERPSVNDLLVKISAASLRQHPGVNASWENTALTIHGQINIGLAVATDDGLVVPVIHSADALRVVDISVRRQEIVAAARQGRLRPADVANGTFTISNLGMFGIDRFQAIVNAPQAAILAVGRISQQIVVRADGFAARAILTLSVAFDHRVVDGARGAQFVQTMAELIEEPEEVLA
jgi:pyruvate dehydrogenase E2 component (dihydrolipoamide acetyltransferase)